MDFPSFSEGLSLRRAKREEAREEAQRFPFLFGRAFIEAPRQPRPDSRGENFPSFSEGLSLRLPCGMALRALLMDFPSFSEGLSLRPRSLRRE